MKDENSTESLSKSSITSNKVGFYSAVLTAGLTFITFVLAMFAVPISGAFCPEGCIDYPYIETVSQFPNDYIWMFPAIFLIIAYTVLMASIYHYTSVQKKIYSHIAFSFALITAVLLITNYFIQVSVIPVSLLHGETEGIPLLTQYNPHGVFIALEDLGYLMMSLSFLFVVPVFSNKNRLETTVRWIFLAGFLLAVVSLIVISIFYGLDRQDRFEVAIITINWLVLIVNGMLLSILFKGQLEKRENY